MENKIKIDLDYIEPNKSYINPLYSEDGRLVLQEREILTEDRIKKIRRIYGNFVYYTENTPEILNASGMIPQRFFDTALDESKHVIEEITKTNKLSKTTFLKAERVIEDIVADLDFSDLKILNLLNKMKSFDDYIYQHLVNVGILTALFAHRIGGFSAEEIKFITLGAYLIDIGLSKIDQQLTKKEGAYTISDIQQIKRHPQLGYELLKGFNDLHPIVLQTVLLHHERYNNRGYYNLPYENLPIPPKIVSICDIYDACTTKRPYRDAYQPSKTLRVLLNSVNKSFDQKLIAEFINFIWPLLREQQTIYEKNDFCVLNSNEIALIKSINKQYILKPVVDVFCRYKVVNKSTQVTFYKRPIEVDLKNDTERMLLKIITEKSHINYLKMKMNEHHTSIML